ncbi:molybdate ABC transporter permease subunit [Alteromonas lipolytica]|uniref:Molybdenum transport system permease n=1 Tax=Alteromonas lipolytica TaxID=1856405 RepID=A0A1E8FG38_9ALTE|nr:molybdate ABC transporter permease subunit [Alteromonas lipolytica]OFI34891.1 molybdenum ABC transporter permease subunit [Alteromonas lipolytica]GGF54884.1 molybdate ABC transporter permease [Alteromonas lipolytica]
MDLAAIWLTLKLAGISTLLLMLLATPLSWALSRWNSRFKAVVQAIVALPLVLPPTVLGFYLLLAFAPDSPIGAAWLAVTGERLAFTFEALVLGSVIYSFPFAVQPLYAGFAQLHPDYLHTARMLNLPWYVRLRCVVLPALKPSLLIAAGLSFAHTIGEFGVVLMIGGNIPGETRVVSIALFDQVESLNYAGAHKLAAILLVFSLVLLMALYWLQGKRRLKWNVM